MTANSLLFLKSHVSAFTRKDGTFVAAHDDKRTAAAPAASSPSTSSAYVSKFSTLEGAKKYQANNPKPTKVFHHPDGGFFVPPHARASSQYEKAGHKVALHYNGKPPITEPTSGVPANADANQKNWGTLPDDDNPTYMMRGLESTHLGHISTGKVDAKRLAHEELASRGQDSDGKWVGFDKAEEHHATLKGKSKPHPSNARVAEHLQSVGSDILSSVAKGHIDMKKRADAELDNRNHDRNGNWIKKT